MHWPDGRKYVGHFALDKMNGHGHLVFPDGREYDGGWKLNVRHGEAKVLTKDGQVKVGEFDNGKVIKWLDTDELNDKLEELKKQCDERERVELEKKCVEE